MKTQLLIPAAGEGARLGRQGPKALVDLAGMPLLLHTLRCFEPLELVEDAIIVVPPGHGEDFEVALGRGFPRARFRFVEGGAERQRSVASGLARLDEDTEIVVIHDAARPFVTVGSIRGSIEAARISGAATVAVPCIDTILRAGEDGFLEETPNRASLWACQTPQTFRVEVIRAAHETALSRSLRTTDDASLVRETGGRVKLIEGSPLNFKVTTPADLAFAEHLIGQGQGDSVRA